jgi:hypothetical protein
VIPDVDILQALAKRKNKPASRVTIAGYLGVDDGDEFARQLSRLVHEEKLQRWQPNGSTFFYALTPAGYRATGDQTYANVRTGVLKTLVTAIAPMAPTHQVDNPGASPGAETSCAKAPEGNRANSNAASGASTIPETAPPKRLRGEEGPKSARRIHRADVADDDEPQETTVTKEHQDHRNLLEQILNKSGEWETLKTIAKAAHLPPGATRSALNALVDEKRIQATGATSSKRYGKLGLAPPSGETRATAMKTKPKRRAAPKRRKATRVTRPRVAAITTAASPVASFTGKGEILLTTPGGPIKVLDVGEVREVIGLVRAFDQAGLLPKAA